MLHTLFVIGICLVAIGVLTVIVDLLLERSAAHVPVTAGQIKRDRQRRRADLSGMHIGEVIHVEPYQLPERFTVRGSGIRPVPLVPVPPADTVFDPEDDLEVS